MRRSIVTRTLLVAACVSAACSVNDPSQESARAGPVARGYVANPAQSRYCSDDCLDIMHAAIHWLVVERGIALSSMVLDTTRTGAVLNGSRVVPAPVVESLVAETGIAQGTREEFVYCYRQPLDAPSCQARNKQAVIVLRPPRQDADTLNHATVQVYYTNTRFIPEIQKPQREFRGFELSLQKGSAGWIVRSVRPTVTS